jgi:serine protease inhibitor
MPIRKLSPNDALQLVKPCTESNNQFAWLLFDCLEKNTVFSPISIAYILSLLHLGAVGETERQISDVKRKLSVQELAAMVSLFNSDIIKMANAVIVNKTMQVKVDYLQMVGDLAKIILEDFSNPISIANQTNAFVEMNTNGLVKDILKPEHISMDTLIVLINTLYFKTVWKSQFNKTFTRKEYFNNTKNTVDMMRVTGDFPYFTNSDLQIVKLPYEGDQFCMGFILVKKDRQIKTLDLPAVLQNSFRTREVEVNIPKFTITSEVDVVPGLQKLGITRLFDSGKSELDKIGGSGTFVSAIKHKVTVIVDEAGTEAAAATAAVVMRKCMSYPELFYADRPFVYFIEHIPTGTLLFIGDKSV